MFEVIFVVQPKAERWNDYLDLAKQLKPKLEAIDGFIKRLVEKGIDVAPGPKGPGKHLACSSETGKRIAAVVMLAAAYAIVASSVSDAQVLGFGLSSQVSVANFVQSQTWFTTFTTARRSAFSTFSIFIASTVASDCPAST